MNPRSRGRLLFTLLALLCAFWLAGCSFSVSTANIKEVVLARNADADLKPVDPTTSFKPEDATIHAIVTLANAPDDTTVRAAWIAEDAVAGKPDFQIDTSEVSSGSGTLHFYITNNGAWPAGHYRLELYLDDKTEPSVTEKFTVTGEPEGVASAPTEAPAAPDPTATKKPATKATREPAPTATAVPAEFSAIVFAEGVGDDGAALGETDQFEAGTTEVHAFADFAGMAEGDEVLEEWYYEGEFIVDNTDSLPAAEGNLHAQLNHEAALPAGTYELALSVDGEELQRGEFTVKEGPENTPIRREDYHSKELGISLTYPEDWVVEEDGEQISFEAPDEAGGAILMTTELEVGLTVESFAELFLDQISQEFDDFEQDEVEDITVDGEPAKLIHCSLTIDGEDALGQVAAVTKGKRALVLMVVLRGEDAGQVGEQMEGFLADLELLSPGSRIEVAEAPTATPEAGPEVLFDDDFSSQEASEEKGWSFSEGENVDYLWSTGEMIIAVKQEDWLGITWPDGEYDDFYAEAEVEAIGDAYAEYGIGWRIGGSKEARSYYVFGITTEGEYYLEEKLGGEWSDEDPVPPAASRAIRMGEPNTLAVRAEGTRISLFINGTRVKTVEDDSLAGGMIGLFVSSGDDQPVAAAFSRLTVTEP